MCAQSRFDLEGAAEGEALEKLWPTFSTVVPRRPPRSSSTPAAATTTAAAATTSIVIDIVTAGTAPPVARPTARSPPCPRRIT